MSNSFIPRSDDALVIWFKKFAAGLAAYVGKCGITPADVGTAQKDAARVELIVGLQAQVQGFAETFTAHKGNLIHGVPKGGPTAPMELPTLIKYPPEEDLPAPVPPGAEKRALSMAARVKRAPDYDDSIGEALGIIAPEHDGALPENMKPAPSVKRFSGGHPVIHCSRGEAELVEIEADHADGKGWVLVAMARRTLTTDLFPLPPAGTAQAWRYRAIFRDATQRIGQWSDVVSVSVAGA